MSEDFPYQDLHFQDRNVYSSLDVPAVNQKELSLSSIPSKDMKVLEKKLHFWRTMTIIVSIFTIVILAIGLSIFVTQCNKQETQKLQQLKSDVCDLTGNRCRYCARNWLYFSGSCYFFSVSPMNWTDSRETCRQMQAQLVVIKSQDEQTFVSQRTQQNFWIGLSKNDRGWFTWEDGTTLANETSFWRDGQPDSRFSKEDCVEINLQGWNDSGCLRERLSICEQPAIAL